MLKQHVNLSLDNNRCACILFDDNDIFISLGSNAELFLF